MVASILDDLDGLADAIANCTDPDDLDAIVTAVELELAERGPLDWIRVLFPKIASTSFAPHHEDFWDWAWSIEEGTPADASVNIWPRGGAKSTSAELAVVQWGARRRRRYVLYVCETQDQADDHVGNVGANLESDRIGALYPDVGRRLVNKFGSSKGWRRNRLRAANGFTVDAIGLDTAARGLKLEDQRPDAIVLDDIDGPFDAPGTVTRKIETITKTVLPAGTTDVVVCAIQNLVHKDGVFARLADGRAEFLGRRRVSGPVPAVRDLVTAYDEERKTWTIVSGEAAWEGQDLAECERLLSDVVGLSAFLSEYQHETRREGGMYAHVLDKIPHVDRSDVPDLVRKAIAVDPAVTDTDGSDSHGVQCDGIDSNGIIYRLRSWEQRASPGQALEIAAEWAYREGLDEVLIEMNTGVDLTGRGIERSWRNAFANAVDRILETYGDENPDWKNRRRPRARKARATQSTGSKAARSSQMLADYETRRGKIVHVWGDHDVLESALGRVFLVKPFDLADAAWYSWRELRSRGNVTTSEPADRQVASTPGERPAPGRVLADAAARNGTGGNGRRRPSGFSPADYEIGGRGLTGPDGLPPGLSGPR